MKAWGRRVRIANPLFYWEPLFNLGGLNLGFFTTKAIPLLLIPAGIAAVFGGIEALRILLIIMLFAVLPRVQYSASKRQLVLLFSLLVSIYGLRLAFGDVLPYEVRGSPLRATGFSSEPSYFAEFSLAIFVCGLALRSKLVVFLAILASMLTLGLTPLQQILLAAVCFLGSLAAWSVRLGPFVTVALISLFPLVLAKLNWFRDLVFLTLSLGGSWRSVSNYQALNLSGPGPALEGYRALISSSFEREGATWIVSVYSFEPFVLLYFGWVGGSLLILFLLWWHSLHVSNERKSLAAHWITTYVYTYYFFFAPKWSLAMVASVWVFLGRDASAAGSRR